MGEEYFLFEHFFAVHALEPGVAEDVFDVTLSSESLFGILVEDPEEEVLSFGGDLDLFRELDLSLLDEFEHETLRLVVEGRQTVHHLESQDAQRPPVRSLVVSSTFQHLRRQVLGSSAEGLGRLAVPHDFGHAEVGEADVAVVVH